MHAVIEVVRVCVKKFSPALRGERLVVTVVRRQIVLALATHDSASGVSEAHPLLGSVLL